MERHERYEVSPPHDSISFYKTEADALEAAKKGGPGSVVYDYSARWGDDQLWEVLADGSVVSTGRKNVRRRTKEALLSALVNICVAARAVRIIDDDIFGRAMDMLDTLFHKGKGPTELWREVARNILMGAVLVFWIVSEVFVIWFLGKTVAIVYGVVGIALLLLLNWCNKKKNNR